MFETVVLRKSLIFRTFISYLNISIYHIANIIHIINFCYLYIISTFTCPLYNALLYLSLQTYFKIGISSRSLWFWILVDHPWNQLDSLQDEEEIKEMTGDESELEAVNLHKLRLCNDFGGKLPWSSCYFIYTIKLYLYWNSSTYI